MLDIRSSHFAAYLSESRCPKHKDFTKTKKLSWQRYRAASIDLLFRHITSMLLAFLLALAATTEGRAAATRPLRIAFLFTSGTMASMWMAKETGGFAKEGLDVEMISMSSTLALPALLANEVDVIQISAVPLINSSLRGFDAVFVAGLLNTMNLDLYAKAGIKNA